MLLISDVGRSFAKGETHKRQIFDKNILTGFPPSAIGHVHDSNSDFLFPDTPDSL
jgi:hypothetical protein